MQAQCDSWGHHPSLKTIFRGKLFPSDFHMNKPPAYNIPLSRLPWFYLLGGLNGFQCTIWQLLFCLFTDQFSLSPPTMLIYWPILSIFLRPPSPWFSLVIYWPVLLFSSHPVPDSAYYLLNNSLFLFSLILFVYCTTLSQPPHSLHVLGCSSEKQ